MKTEMAGPAKAAPPEAEEEEVVVVVDEGASPPSLRLRFCFLPSTRVEQKKMLDPLPLR